MRRRLAGRLPFAGWAGELERSSKRELQERFSPEHARADHRRLPPHGIAEIPTHLPTSLWCREGAGRLLCARETLDGRFRVIRGFYLRSTVRWPLTAVCPALGLPAPSPAPAAPAWPAEHEPEDEKEDDGADRSVEDQAEDACSEMDLLIATRMASFRKSRSAPFVSRSKAEVRH